MVKYKKSDNSYYVEASEIADEYFEDIDEKSKEREEAGMGPANDPYKGDSAYLTFTIEKFLQANTLFHAT